MADYVSQYLGEEIDQYLGEGHAAYNQLGGKASAEELAAETAARIQAVTLEKEAREAADKDLAADAHKTYPTRIEKLADFAYSAHYDTVNYEEAKKYFASNYEANIGACSAFWKDGVLYRNYDWYYSNNAGFLVHTPAGNGRHAVVGAAGYINGLTDDVVESGAHNEKYSILPFLMTDGMNDAGLSAAVLVCENKDVTPTAQNTGKKKMNGLFIVRYVLDNHTDALEAAQDIADNYDVYMPHTDSVDEELHFIIGDKEKCVILEFVNNDTKIIQDHNFVTNFKLFGTTHNADGTIDYTTVRPYGQGVERYNIIASQYDSIYPVTGKLLLETLKYTNAYNAPGVDSWRTEFTGVADDLTVAAAFETPAKYISVISDARELYLARTRESQKTWQTCHSVVYDANTMSLAGWVQEDSTRIAQKSITISLEDEIAARKDADAALWTAVNNAATKDEAKGIDVRADQYTAKRINLAGENVLGQLNALLNGVGETTTLNQELNGILAIGLGGFTMSVHNIQLSAREQKYVQIAITPLGISDDGQSLDWIVENSNECVLVRRRDANGWQPWKPLHKEIVGKLGDLNTTDKSNVVAAINEVYETVVITADLLWAATSTGLPSLKSIPVQQIYEVASADGNRGKMVKVVANDNSGRYITCMVNLIAKPNEYNIFAFVPYSDTPVIYKLHYAPGFPTRPCEVINLANSVNKVNLSDSTSTDRWPNMTVAEFGEVIEKSGINYDTMYPVVVTWKSQNKVYLVQSILTANTSVVRLLDINIMDMYDYALDSKTQTVAKTYVNMLTNLSDVSSYFQKMAGAIIGDVSTLNTTEKSVVPAINEVLDNAATKDEAKGVGVSASQYTAKRINLTGAGDEVLTKLNALLNGVGATTELNQELNGILVIGIGGFTMSVHNIQLNAASQKYIQLAVTPLGISNDGQSLDWGIENSNECVLVRRRDANGWQSWKPLHQEIVGKLGDLTTTDKSSIVAAINEINDSQEQLLFKLNYDEEAYPLLQPTAYDAETGYFTCESMPAWVTDNVMANVHIHDKYKWSKMPYVYPRSANSMGEATIHIVDTTHFYVEWGDASSSIPADVDCTNFAFCYFSYDFREVICPLEGRTEGSDYYRIEWENLNSYPSNYMGCIGFSINAHYTYSNYIKAFFCSSLQYQRRHVINCRGSMIIRIDKVPNGNYYDVSVNLISGSQESMYRDSKTSTSISTMVTVLDKSKLNIWGGSSYDVVLTSLPLTPASEVRVYKLNNKLFEK